MTEVEKLWKEQDLDLNCMYSGCAKCKKDFELIWNAALEQKNQRITKNGWYWAKAQITENSLNLSLKQVHKLQRFYTNWVEPLKKVMPSELFKSWDDVVKEYSLLEAEK